MTTIEQRVSKQSLDFVNQQKAYLLRKVDKKSYEDIAGEVVNIRGDNPSWGTVRNICDGFSEKKGYRPYLYKRSGRKPWKLTTDVQKYVLRRLLADRMTKVVTSTSLAEDVAKTHGVIVEASCLRKFLVKKGYKWLPRSQKRRYSKEDLKTRLKFVKAAVRLSMKDLRAKLNMCLDGVVLSMPPANETERFNYCWAGFNNMWRKSSEANKPCLAGGDGYDKQVPLSRAIPLWGGVSADGFAAVMWHPRKKTDNEEWSKVVRDGDLTKAIRQINPKRKGPWTVLCDNEGFLRHKGCMRAYARKNIRLWGVPPRSPDLNPVEMFWGWVRRQLRLKDLADMKEKRVPLGKMAYTLRVKTLLRGKKAQRVAGNCATRFRKTCLQVVKMKGAAASN